MHNTIIPLFHSYAKLTMNAHMNATYETTDNERQISNVNA